MEARSNGVFKDKLNTFLKDQGIEVWHRSENVLMSYFFCGKICVSVHISIVKPSVVDFALVVMCREHRSIKGVLGWVNKQQLTPLISGALFS